ncbi:hypothetical protein D9M71_497730 [compost metagenome]
MLGVFVGVVRIFSTDHLLVQLLAGANADHFLAGFRCNYTGQIGDLHGWDLLDVDLAAFHVFERMPYQLNGFFERDHEAGHAIVGNRQYAFVLDRHEEGDHRAARAHDVAVTDDGKARVVTTRVGVACHEQFVGGQFGGTVQVDRAAGFVSRQSNSAFHTFVDTGIDQVHGAIDVGLHALERVVFGRGYDLGGGGVYDVIDAVQCAI